MEKRAAQSSKKSDPRNEGFREYMDTRSKLHRPIAKGAIGGGLVGMGLGALSGTKIGLPGVLGGGITGGLGGAVLGAMGGAAYRFADPEGQYSKMYSRQGELEDQLEASNSPQFRKQQMQDAFERGYVAHPYYMHRYPHYGMYY